jgi:pimeloyl-ACP methyl ester carboxylesterase
MGCAAARLERRGHGRNLKEKIVSIRSYEGTLRGARTGTVERLDWRAALWGNRWLGAAVVTALAAVTALISSIPMPRGPVTGGQGLVVIGVSLLVGIAAGYLMHSRWALLLAPLAYIAAYELARIGIAGASLEGFRFDSVYGIAAFAAGRGIHGLLALLPMVVGLSIGLALARPRRLLALVPTGTLSLGVIGLAVLVALPGSTPPVLGAGGQPVPGSIAELTTVDLGGHQQAISIRAADPDKPVLLYLSGGPGQSDIAFARALLQPFEQDFVVVVWDQRGSGKSYAALDPTSTYTLDGLVGDTIALTDYLRERFAEDKIYLLGESWGSTLGVLAVQARPDLFHAYIGSGQMVSQRVTDQIIWRDLLAYADRTGDGELYDQVLTLGEPPYRDAPWANSLIMGYYGLLETPYTPPAPYVARGEASGVGSFGLFGSEYSFVENANLIRGLVDMFSLMYPQLQSIDFRTDVPELEVPVYMLDGANELRGRRELAHEWFAALSAPHKELITYADAAHAVAFEQADAFLRLMNEEIVPATYRNAGGEQ